MPKSSGDEALAGDHLLNFLDSKRAVAINFLNQFYLTEDGGKTWQKQIVPTNLRCQLPEPVDFKTVFVGSPQSVVNYTLDGGKSWQRIEGTFGLMACSMPKADYGLFYNWTKIVVYQADKKDFQEVNVPKNLGKGISATALLNKEKVFIIGQNGRFVFSADLGENWQEIKLPTSAEQELVYDYLQAALRFKEQGKGLLFVFDKRNNCWVTFSSDNAGQSWQTENVLKGFGGRVAISPDLNYVTIMPFQTAERIIVLGRK